MDNLPLLFCAGTAGMVSFFLLPFFRRLAPALGVMDVPRDNRRMHHVPIPRTGGLAIGMAFFLVLPFSGISPPRFYALLCGGLILYVGVLDDAFRFPPLPKLAVQAVAAVGAVCLFFGERGIPAPFSAFPPLFAYGAAILWIVTLTNAHNMTDGLDGLCGSVSLAEALVLGVLLYLSDDTAGAASCAALAAALLPFLARNRHPASVFLGDAGSTFLGFGLAVLSFGMQPPDAGVPGASLYVFVYPLLFCVPLYDICVTVVRRAVRGKNPFAADRGHLHHRLSDRGFSQSAVTGWLFVFALGGALLALTLFCRAWYPYGTFLTLGLAGGVTALAWKEKRNRVFSAKGGFDE